MFGFKNKIKVDILMLLFILITTVMTAYIFYNSSQTPGKSIEKSNAISDTIQAVVDPDESISNVEFKKFIRKAAHVLEFALFGINLGIIFLRVHISYKRIFISLPLFLSLSVGVIDEYIQFFHNRTSCLKDVLIDFSGAIVGLFLVFLFGILYRKRMIVNKKRW